MRHLASRGERSNVAMAKCKVAVALHVDTWCEGVSWREYAKFLRWLYYHVKLSIRQDAQSPGVNKPPGMQRNTNNAAPTSPWPYGSTAQPNFGEDAAATDPTMSGARMPPGRSVMGPTTPGTRRPAGRSANSSGSATDVVSASTSSLLSRPSQRGLFCVGSSDSEWSSASSSSWSGSDSDDSAGSDGSEASHGVNDGTQLTPSLQCTCRPPAQHLLDVVSSQSNQPQATHGR